MNLGMTFIYLVCGTCALIMFSIAFFVLSAIVMYIIDGKKGNVGKTKNLEPQIKRKVVGGNLEPEKFAEKERIESSGLKIYAGE